jgi:hypothetical protein
MVTIGHGVSDAVRNHISIWIDDAMIDSLYAAYKESGGKLNKSSFCIRIRQPKEWVRRSRSKTSSGYERVYRCKTVEKATIIVHSPASDMSANGYVLCIDGTAVGGGKTNMKSTRITNALSKSDKSTTSLTKVQYVRFSEAELQTFRIQMEYGDGFHSLDMDREA